MSVLLQTMREWATFSADICILLITAYTFYITFISKKLKLLSFSVNNSDRGDSFHLVLENRSFAPICIEEIYLVFSGQHKIKFGEYQQPVVLNAFSAIGLSMEPFSFLYPSVSSWEVRNDLVVCVVTSRKNLYLTSRKQKKKLSKEIKAPPPDISVIRRVYDGQLVMPGNRYVLHLFHEGKTQTIFLHKHGVMSESVLGYNALPEAAMKDRSTVMEALDCFLKPYKIEYVLEDFIVDAAEPFSQQ